MIVVMIRVEGLEEAVQSRKELAYSKLRLLDQTGCSAYQRLCHGRIDIMISIVQILLRNWD